jgi:putative hydrolase of the HAD superfamily
VIRLVTIDCWDTLLRNNHAWDSDLVRIAQEAFSAHAAVISDEQIASAFREEAAEFSRILAEEMVTLPLLTRLKALARYAGVEESEAEFRRLQNSFEEAILDPLPELVPGAREFLMKVKGRNLKLGLVSNTGWFSFRALGLALNRHGIWKLFDFFAFSDQVGSAKPSARIFDFALAAAGCRPAEAVHIGDNLTTDVKGALDAGLGAIHFLPGAPDADGNPPSGSGFDQVWTALSLRLDLAQDS